MTTHSLLYKRIESSFLRQGLMNTLRASLDNVEDGLVQISSTYDESLSQQHQFFHVGVMTSIADSACGYAALTRAPADKDVLTVEFKINFLKPAHPPRIIAIGTVIQAGRTLTICESHVYDDSGQNLIAKMTATIMTIGPREA